MARRVLTAVTCVLVLAAAASAAQPVGWRTDGTGRYPDAKVPISWGPDKNVIWKTPMPSWSNATPVIADGKIIVCSEPAKVLCVSASDGKVLWSKSFGYDQLVPPDEAENVRNMMAAAKPLSDQIGRKQRELRGPSRKLKQNPDDAEAKAKVAAVKKEIAALNEKLAPMKQYMLPKTHNVNGLSSPTPVTDGEHVYVLSGLGTAACFDLAGNRKWIKMIARPRHGWGHSASPVLVGGKLITHILGLVALDAKTGEQLWKAPSKSVWGSPAVAKIGSTNVVIVSNGDAFRAADGKKLASRLSKLEFGTPTLADGVVYFVQSGGSALKLPAEAGDSLKCERLWKTSVKKDRYYASPVIHDGLIYCITRACHFSVVDAADGKVVYEKALKLGGGKREAYPSITLVGKYVLVSADNGTTAIVEPGREFKLAATNSLERFRSSPVVVGNRLYIRGYKHLYCIGE